MANTNTVLIYPDGKKEERKVLTHLNNKNLDVVVFDMEKELNGNQCTHVSYLAPEGRYQNIVDPEIWDQCKKMFIANSKNEAEEWYQPVPNEMYGTHDPDRELYIPLETFTKISQNYENYLAKLNTVEEINQNNPLEYNQNPLGTETPIISNETTITPTENFVSNENNNLVNTDIQEVKIVEENPSIQSESSMPNIPSFESPLKANNVEINNGIGMGEAMNSGNQTIPDASAQHFESISTPIIENNTINEVTNTAPQSDFIVPDFVSPLDAVKEESIPSITTENTSIPTVEPAITTIPSIEQAPVPDINPTPINNEPIPFPEMIAPDNVSNNQNSTSEISTISETPTIESKISEPINQNENIIPFPEPIPSVVTETPLVENTLEQNNFNENVIPFPAPVPSVKIEEPVVENKSIITESYTKSAKEIEEKMEKRTEEFVNDIKEISNQYFQAYKKDMESLLNQMNSNLEDTAVLRQKMNELYDKQSQNMMQNQEGPSLTRAA